MKKLFLILVAVLVTMSTTAQSADSLQVASMDARIDSLSAKLEKLQHDHDYLRCSSDLNMMVCDFRIFINELEKSSYKLLINCYHDRYNDDLYVVNRRNRDVYVDLYGSYKEKAVALKRFVSLMMETKDFTESEKTVLILSMDTLDKCFGSADAALEYYNLVMSFYKDKE